MFSAGSVFLDIVPSFRKFGEASYFRQAEQAGKDLGERAGSGFDEGFERTAGKSIPKSVGQATKSAADSSEKSGEDAGNKFAGAFRKSMQSGIAQATSDLGKGVDDELARIQRRLKSLGDLKIGTDISPEDAVRSFAAVEKQLKAAAKNTDLTIEARVNAEQGAKDLAKFRSLVEAATKPVEQEIKLDTSNTLRGMYGLRATGEKIFAKPIDLLVKPDLRSTAAFGALRTSLDQIIGRPLTAKVEIEANQENVNRTLAEIKTRARLIKAEVDIGVKGDKKAAADLLILSRQVEALDGRNVDIDTKINIASTLAQLAALRSATRSANNEALDGANTFRSFSGILLGVAAVGPLVVPALAAVTGGILALGAAGASVGAGLGVTILGFSGIGDAVKGLSDVQGDAEKDALSYATTLRTASRGVRDAEQGVADARRTAARSAEDSARRVTDARRGVVEAEARAAQDVQGALRAQADAERALADQQRSATQAQEDLVDARQRAQDQIEDLALRSAGGALAERQAVLDLADARRQAAEAGLTRQPGGSFSRPSSGNAEQEQASINLGRAQLRLQEIRIENARLGEEQAEVARTGVEGTDLVVQARERLRDANRGVADAEQNVRDAALAVAQAQEEGSARIAAAQRGVTDAIRAQTEAQQDAQIRARDAQERLADAQERYQEALVKTGDLGSASVQRLEEAFDKLGPAGQEFARFLFGLRGQFHELRNAAQAGLLPGVQEGLEIILNRYGPGLLAFVGTFGQLLGDLFVRFAESLSNPAFANFFELMAEKGGLFLEQWFEIGLNLTQIVLAIVTAFSPLTEELGGALVDLTASWLDWANALSSTQGFQDFLDYLRVAGPQVFEFFVQLVDALINLGVALAPFAGTLLQFFTGFLDFISEMDPDVLGAIAVAIIGVVLAAQVLYGIATLFLATGVLAQAFGALFAFLTGAATLTATAVGAIVGSFLAAVILVGIAIIFLYTHFEGFRNAISGVVGFLGTVFDLFLTGLKIVGSFLADFFGPLVASLFENVKDAANAFYEAIKPAIDIFIESLPTFGKLLQGLFLIISPFLLFIGTVIGVLLNVVVNVFNEIVVPLFSALGKILGGAIKIIVGLVQLLVGVFTGDFGLMKEAVINIFTGLWDIVFGILRGAWDIVFGIVKGIVTGVVDFFSWLFDVLVGNSIIPDMVKAIIAWFLNLKNQGIALIKLLIDKVINFFVSMFIKVVLLFRDGVRKILGFFKDLGIRGVAFIRGLVEKVGNLIGVDLLDVFSRGVAAIGNAWDGLKELAKTPIRFLIETVLNKGLISSFNTLMDLLGADGAKIDPVPVPSFLKPAARQPARAAVRRAPTPLAEGGRVPGYSPHAKADNIPAWLTAGEYVLPVGATQRLKDRFGADFLEALRHGLPGYAGGGLVQFGRSLQRRGITVTGHSQFPPVGRHTAGSTHYSDRALDLNAGAGTSQREQRILDQLIPEIKQMGYNIIWRVANHFNHMHISTGKGRNDIGGSLGKGYSGSGGVDDSGGGFLAGFKGAISGLVDAAGNLLTKPVNWLKETVTGFIGEFSSAPLGRILKAGSNKLLDAAMDKVTSLFGLGDFGPGEQPAVGNTGSARAAVANAAQGYGWDKGEMWSALKWIVQRESSFNPNAQNPRSTAYGLFQFLNSTWAGTGFKKSSDPDVQAAAGLKYIKDRYGNPLNAKYFHQSNGYYADGGEVGEAPPTAIYDTGGIVPKGLSQILNLTGGNEHLAVMTPEQIQWAEARGESDMALVGSLTMNTQAQDPYAVVDELSHKLRTIKRGGKYHRRA